MSNAVAIVHRAEILEAIASGKRLSDIAPKYGVIPNAISKVLKDDPEYKQAMELSFERRIDEAEQAILDAADQVDVSRARAYWGAVSWRAGVECPARWGQRQQLQVEIVDRSALLAEARSRIIDVTPDVALHPPVQTDSTE